MRDIGALPGHPDASLIYTGRRYGVLPRASGRAGLVVIKFQVQRKGGKTHRQPMRVTSYRVSSRYILVSVRVTITSEIREGDSWPKVRRP